jgi:hypothetical protein
VKLPNLDQAYVPPDKITKYLLSEENSGGKAEFFIRFGFSMAKWEVLAHALYDHAVAHEVNWILDDEHGTKYVIEGELIAPDERRPFIRTIWLIEKGQSAARFITAYPI